MVAYASRSFEVFREVLEALEAFEVLLEVLAEPEVLRGGDTQQIRSVSMCTFVLVKLVH